MTELEAIEIAGTEAGERNIPWCAEAAVGKRRRVWPFPAFWRVVSRTENGDVITTMIVREPTRKARPVQVLHGANIPSPPVQPRLVWLFVFKLAVSGSIFWLLLRYGAHSPIWKATLLAIPCSFAGVFFFEGILFRIHSRKYEKEEDETDEA